MMGHNIRFEGVIWKIIPIHFTPFSLEDCVMTHSKNNYGVNTNAIWINVSADQYKPYTIIFQNFE